MTLHLTCKAKCVGAPQLTSSELRVVKFGVVLYEVPQDLIRQETAEALGRRSLDAIEAEGKNYKRVPIAVRLFDGQVVEAVCDLHR